MKRLLSSLLLSFGLLLAGLAVRALPALAATDPLAGTEHITNFHSDVALTSQNVVTVKETIVYDFGSVERHGIYRYIPVENKDDQGNIYHIGLKLLSVTDENGTSYAYQKPQTRPNYEIKIGDKNTLISGVHTYVITYQLTPVVTKGNGTDGADRLSLNITGNGWDVPISQSSVALSTPNIPLLSAKCYTGVYGTTASDCTVRGDNITTNRALEAHEGLTIDVALKPGLMSTYLIANALTTEMKINLALLALAGAGLLGAIFLKLAKLIQAYRRRRDQVIIPEYSPPDKLRPAELGMLSDNRSDMVEVTATLIDLAVRGYLKIEQTKPKSLLGKAEYRLHKLKESADTEDYEKILMDAIFGTNSEVDLTNIDRTSVADAVKNLHEEMGERLTDKGYYTSPPNGILHVLQIIAWFAIIIVLGIAVGFYASGHPLAIVAAIADLALAAWLIWLVAVGYQRTATGLKEWAGVEGFKLFLSVTEKDRLKFSDAPERTPELFNKLLPYAIALKVENEWAKQFAGIDVAPSSSGWYVGNNYLAFSALNMTSDLSSGFSQSVASGFAPVSSGSGGFGGGGGFSGGGFGGGGGGSW